jgi:hypothetical protein
LPGQLTRSVVAASPGALAQLIEAVTVGQPAGQALNHNLDPVKASQVPAWRESDVFTPLERDVLEYAEAMTTTPTTVTDELYARLLGQLGPAAMVELTVFIGAANMGTRVNTADGVTSQGYSDACEIPLARRPQASGVTSTA